MNTTTQHILVVGASRGSGHAQAIALAAAGHRVTALARHASAVEWPDARLTAVDGDATDPAALDAVLPDHDAVVIALGISENPMRVRLRGAATTPDDVRSRGTQRVVEAMQRHGVRRLVVQSTYGLGAGRERLSASFKFAFRFVLAPQIADTERQEQIVRASGLDWTLLRPVGLNDSTEGIFSGAPFVSTTDQHAGMKVSRAQVAAACVAALADASTIGATLSISATSAAAAARRAA